MEGGTEITVIHNKLCRITCNSSKCYLKFRVKGILGFKTKIEYYWHNKSGVAVSVCMKNMSMKNQNMEITSEKGIWRHVSFAFYHILVTYGLVYNTN